MPVLFLIACQKEIGTSPIAEEFSTSKSGNSNNEKLKNDELEFPDLLVLNSSAIAEVLISF